MSSSLLACLLLLFLLIVARVVSGTYRERPVTVCRLCQRPIYESDQSERRFAYIADAEDFGLHPDTYGSCLVHSHCRGIPVIVPGE